LDDYLDRNLSPDEARALEQHLDVCLKCLRRYRFEQSLLDGIRSHLRRVHLPSQLIAALKVRLGAAGEG